MITNTKVVRCHTAANYLALGLFLAAFPLNIASSQTGTTTQPLIVENGTTKFWTQNNSVVPMCWHILQLPNATAVNDAKNFVMQTIKEGWLDFINLKITWVDCPTSGGALHVRVLLRSGDANYNGTTLQLGMGTLSNAADRLRTPPNDPPGLLMGFRADWNLNNATRAVFRSLILHEFGHVLGFGHEQNRPDGAPNVTCYNNNFPNAVLIGPPDPQSIMGFSYCATALGILTLSDVRGVRSIYGKHDIAIRGALLVGGFRTQRELNAMSFQDRRNTLIVELVNRTNQAVGHFQSLDDASLAGAGATLVFLREAGIRTDAELKTMSDDDQRNTLIVVVNSQIGIGVPALQSMSSADIVALALGKSRSFIRGVLLAGKFRTLSDLSRMSADDQRNTLIVELTNRTNQSVSHFQSLNDAALAGAGAVLVTLRRAQIRTDSELKQMSDDDQRNTLIVEMGLQTGLGSQLQGLSNLDLVGLALGIFP